MKLIGSRASALGRMLLAVAAVLSLVLGGRSIAHLDVLGCGVGSGCESVLGSVWAWIGPVPVAWLGALVYATQVLLLSPRRKRQTGLGLSGLLICLFGANVAAAIFFGFLQAFVIGSWCPWCCTIHGMALLGTLLVVWATRNSDAAAPQGLSSAKKFAGIAWSTAGMLILLATFTSLLPDARSQEKASKPPATTGSRTRKLEGGSTVVQLHDGKFQFDLGTLPLLGDPNAKHIVVCITDPTCPYCRSTSQMLRQAWTVQPAGEVAILFLPGIREASDGQELQLLLLTIWREKPEAWREITEQIDAGILASDFRAVYGSATESLGGSEKLNAALQVHREWAQKLIKETGELMAENARQSGQPNALPQTQYESQLIVGALSDADDLRSLTVGELNWVWNDGLANQIFAEPCKKRKFCGNLTILFNGAGENLSNDPENRGVDHAARETVQFLDRTVNPARKNSKVLLLSSDSTKAVADAIAAAKNNGEKLSAHPHIPSRF